MTRPSLCPLFLAVLLAAVVPDAAYAQTVDEIIAKNVQAKGGVERLRSINTIRQASRMHMPGQGMEAPVLILSKRPNLMRQEITLGNIKVITGFDGQVTWIVNPLVSPGGAPIQMSGPEAEITREQASFDSPFLNYKERGYKIEYVGTETLNNRQVYHLRVMPPVRSMTVRPQTQHAYIDVETGLETKLVTETDRAKLEQEFADYKQVDGLTVPFTIRQLVNGVLQSEMKVEKVELNINLSDDLFAMPKK